MTMSPSRSARYLPPLLIAFAGLAVYANSFSGPFVFDDLNAIVENPTLRHLWPLGPVLTPPSGGLTVSGRPLLNLTLAINYAFGGTAVWGYHALNLGIHILAGVTLFGIARRTLRSDPTAAFLIALLWTVHPLQTESVTYIVQRAESLMGLFYLLTLYCFIRWIGDQGRENSGRLRPLFAAFSILFCLLGMATKEVMVSAPVVLFLYDRTFFAGSFREAWRRRRSFYLGLASTWILLGYLVVGEGGGRSGSVGVGGGVSWWAYGLTQFEAIVRYLQLTVWPHPLVFEYGTFWVKSAGQFVPYACVVAVIVAATGVALLRYPAWGFLGFWFFAILAPTSLVPGTTQMIVEHRMYLALAPLLAGLICGGHALLAAFAPTRRFAAGAWTLALLAFATVSGVLAASRNEDYRSGEALWADTAAKRPESALAHNNLGTALEKIPGRLNDAIGQYQEALQLNPGFHEAHNNLGDAWLEVPGKLNDAIAQYEEALRLRPDFAEAHNNLGNAWSRIPGRTDDAIAQYQAALRLKPAYAGAHNNLGKEWLALPGRSPDAIAEFAEALRLKPDFAEAHNNLGNAWGGTPGKLTDAIAEFEEAIRLKPDFAEAHNNLGNAWAQVPGRLSDAIAQCNEALRLRPDYAEAHNNLGNALLGIPNRLNEAVAHYEEAIRLNPDYAEPQFNLAVALLRLPDRTEEAVRHLQAFLRLRPNDEQARQVLAALMASRPEPR